MIDKIVTENLVNTHTQEEMRKSYRIAEKYYN